MVVPIILLLSLGITVIYTSSQSLAFQQLFYAVVGLGFYGLLRFVDYRAVKFFIKPAYIFILFLLLITLVLGIESRGSVRWIPLLVFNLQPSEFAKPVLILALAEFWSRKYPSWKNIAISAILTLPFLLLIFRQPDLGTTLTVFFIWVIMLFASNVSFKKMLILSAGGLSLIPFSYFFLQGYQKQRLESFLNPTIDPQGIGFHVIQSMIAVGSGEVFGRGLGRGTQSRLQFLPEFRTDFIFAFIAEELGFFGSLLVLLTYTAIFYLGFKTLLLSNDRFGELITVGVMAMLLFQVFINIGMNIGILPVTGITLPLLSYGGSSVISTLVCLGLVNSVSRFGVKRREMDTLALS